MDTFIITCEHGGNRIPAPYRRLFREQRALLDSHRGYDPGSLVMAKALANAYRAPLVASTVSRLLIDLNRSIGHPQLLSAVTRAAPAETRAQIVEQYYRPHRTQVECLVGQTVSSRTPQLPLCRQRRRVDLAPARALRAVRLRRNRTGSQPGHSLRRRPALDGVSAS